MNNATSSNDIILEPNPQRQRITFIESELKRARVSFDKNLYLVKGRKQRKKILRERIAFLETELVAAKLAL